MALRHSSIAFVLSLLAQGLAGQLQAQALPAYCPPWNNKSVSIVIAGGVSEGAWEAGVLYALVHALKACDNVTLGGLAGTSAGGINTLAGAIDWLDPPGSTAKSTLWNVWKDADIGTLAPRQLPCSSAMCGESRAMPCVGPDALLSRKGFAPVVDHLKQRLANGPAESKGNSVPIGFAVSLARPEVIAGLERNRVALILSVTARDGKFVVSQPDLDTVTKQRQRLVGARFRLAGDPELPMWTWLPALLGTSAFPTAFSAVPLVGKIEFSGHIDATERSQARPVRDGGIFDNVPRALAAVLPHLQPAGTKAEPVEIVVDAEQTRGEAEATPSATPAGLSGAAAVAWQWIDFNRRIERGLTVGDNGQTCSGNDKLNCPFRVTRWHQLGASLAANFGALLHQHVRRHDFAIGVADGRQLLASRAPTARLPSQSELGLAGLRDTDDIWPIVDAALHAECLVDNHAPGCSTPAAAPTDSTDPWQSIGDVCKLNNTAPAGAFSFFQEMCRTHLMAKLLTRNADAVRLALFRRESGETLATMARGLARSQSADSFAEIVGATLMRVGQRLRQIESQESGGSNVVPGTLRGTGAVLGWLLASFGDRLAPREPGFWQGGDRMLVSVGHSLGAGFDGLVAWRPLWCTAHGGGACLRGAPDGVRLGLGLLAPRPGSGERYFSGSLALQWDVNASVVDDLHLGAALDGIGEDWQRHKPSAALVAGVRLGGLVTAGLRYRMHAGPAVDAVAERASLTVGLDALRVLRAAWVACVP